MAACPGKACLVRPKCISIASKPPKNDARNGAHSRFQCNSRWPLIGAGRKAGRSIISGTGGFLGNVWKKLGGIMIMSFSGLRGRGRRRRRGGKRKRRGLKFSVRLLKSS
jgi:hypothetical protein